MDVSKSAHQLGEMIKKAIDDGQLTSDEYDQILALADEDGVIDTHERNLLKSLQDMLADGSVKRVK